MTKILTFYGQSRFCELFFCEILNFYQKIVRMANFLKHNCDSQFVSMASGHFFEEKILEWLLFQTKILRMAPFSKKKCENGKWFEKNCENGQFFEKIVRRATFSKKMWIWPLFGKKILRTATVFRLFFTILSLENKICLGRKLLFTCNFEIENGFANRKTNRSKMSTLLIFFTFNDLNPLCPNILIWRKLLEIIFEKNFRRKYFIFLLKKWKEKKIYFAQNNLFNDKNVPFLFI